MRIVFIFLCFMSGLLSGLLPAAAEWHFCYAMTDLQHKVYFSDIFNSDLGLSALDRSFADWLEAHKIDYSSANCPRADTQMAIQINLDAAKKYNLNQKRAVDDVPFPRDSKHNSK
jgi:hypothetical protein